MQTVEKALSHSRANLDRYTRELMDLLKIPSVSTLSEHAPDVQSAAEWLADRLKRMGFETDILPTAGQPVVLGSLRKAPASAPTLLFYGHYDVQPAEPLEEWISPPFSPVIRGENLFARGGSDMKGSVVAFLAAVESVLEAGSPPVQIKVLLEGEEEIGSPHLAAFIKAHKDLLACDAVLNGDALVLRPDLPAIVYGLRGLAYFELRVETAGHDLHSGLFGGGVPNAGQTLCELIAGMHDAEGRVTLPYFYDDVVPLDREEREALARVPYDEREFLAQSSVRAVLGEAGYTTTERVGARPTLEVNGLLCGFTGEGSKTVLPAHAMAKISMRLVPNQKPERIKAQLEEYLRARAPAWVKWELLDLAGGPAAIVRRDTPAMRAAIRALEGAYGNPPVFAREGGSVPAVSLIQEILGKDSILVGVSLPDDNVHAPNEKLHLPTFQRGIEMYVRFLYELVR